MADVPTFNNVNVQSIQEVPPGYIVNRSYNDDRQLEYLGWAQKGTADSDDYWSIREYQYDANKQLITERLTHNAVWDNRSAEVYE